jgi:hypothetical protein
MFRSIAICNMSRSGHNPRVLSAPVSFAVAAKGIGFAPMPEIGGSHIRA